MLYAQILKRKNGIALMSVMLFFTLIVVFIGSLSFVSLQNIEVADVPTQNMAAFYAAEAGLNKTIHEFEALYQDNFINENDVATALTEIRDNFTPYRIVTLANNEGQTTKTRISFTYFNLDIMNSHLNAVIQTEGIVGDTQRVLKREISFSFDDINMFLVRHAVLVSHTIRTENGTITSTNPNDPLNYPRVATMLTAQSSIATQRLTFPNGIREFGANVVFPVIDFTGIRNQATHIFGNNPQLTHETLAQALSGNAFRRNHNYIRNLNFSQAGNNHITIPRGEHVFIMTDALTLGNVEIRGEGRLTIYVRPGRTTFSPNANNTVFGRTVNEEKLAIYVDRIDNVANNAYHATFQNNSITRGYFMFYNARISFLNNSELWGGIFTGAVNGNSTIDAIRLHNNASLNAGGGHALLVAPNGRVYFENNARMTGAVIGRDFVQNSGGNSRLTFDPNILSTIPFAITSPNPVGTGSAASGRSLILSPTIER